MQLANIELLIDCLSSFKKKKFSRIRKDPVNYHKIQPVIYLNIFWIQYRFSNIKTMFFAALYSFL